MNASIRRIVDQTFLAVGSSLPNLMDREAQELQRSVHAALREAANVVQEHFVEAPKISDR